MALELLRVDPYDGDSSTGTTYYGYAAAGVADSEPKWSIKRKTVVNGVLKYEFPYIDGTILPETNPGIVMNDVTYLQISGLVWDLRATYKYK